MRGLLLVVLALLFMNSFVAAQQAPRQGAVPTALCLVSRGRRQRAGPAAVAFKVQPQDLTAMSQQNRGKFPKDRVAQASESTSHQTSLGGHAPSHFHHGWLNRCWCR